MQKDISWKFSLIWISFYGIAMGFLESAVVVYLRRIYYPYGFDFPLASMESSMVGTEVLRELATMIMLLTVSILSGRNFRQRIAYFIYSFAIWDIFYYIFLYVLTGWPSSLMTWDILFLIPDLWVGPVISPVLVSITMIVLALIILVKDAKGLKFNLNFFSISFFIAGACLVFLAFVWDYSRYMLNYHTLKELLNLPENRAVFDTAGNYLPQQFNWFLFIFGEVLVISAIILPFFRNKSIPK